LIVGFRHLHAWRSVLSRLVLIRALLEAAVSFLFITSLAVLPLADVTAILQSTPIVLTVMAVALGIERVGWRRWSAILCGFAGVLLIVKPGPASLEIYALLAFASAVLIAARDLVTGAISARVPSLVITFSTTFAVMVAGAVIGLVEDWRPMPPGDAILLLGAAALVTLGNFGIILAFRDTDVSVVSPFRYSVVPLAILLGVIVFAELPDGLSLLGILLIVAGGLYTILDQARRGRAAPKPG
jgi:drug/metabolite transporter (DMT)-like permease